MAGSQSVAQYISDNESDNDMTLASFNGEGGCWSYCRIEKWHFLTPDRPHLTTLTPSFFFSLLLKYEIIPAISWIN
jgi:hypothetical protein